MNISYNPGLYLHIPFCESKCGYCDFFSIEETSLIKPFIDALITEIDLTADRIQTKALFDTIYLGGGTPSLLSIKNLELILNTLANHFNFNKACEITIEINPGTVNLSQLQEIAALGIDRISIGVQSFLDHELMTAERIHTADDATKAIDNCRQAGFQNINIDLIFALPNQSIDNWKYSLSKAISYRPEHLSVYNLTYEEGTPFFKRKMNGEFPPFGEDVESAFFEIGHQILSDEGYIHYEISNYAISENHVSRHNYKYWNHTPFLGFGPSAHSYWLESRWANVRSVTKYLAAIANSEFPIDFSEDLDKNELMFEHIFLALRTYRGISLVDFTKRFGVQFNKLYKSDIQILEHEKLAKINKGYFQLTDKGMLICDEILLRFSKI
jgi:oxygen-independent coproporphyrinogen-3 oxidase